MFSYTDDAIVTSSQTGRHLGTVIRRPAAIGPLDWNEHADQVCKVLNELRSKAKAHSLSLHLQTVGRVYRHVPNGRSETLGELRSGPTWPFEDQMPLATEATPRSPVEIRMPLKQRVAELEKQLDDATTKLCAAQMLLEQADGKVSKLETKLTEALGVRKVRVPVKSLSVLASSYGVVMHFADQKLTIESV